MRQTMMVHVTWFGIFLAGCSAAPVTDGYQRELPKPGTRTLVWGNDMSTITTASTWLQRRGLSIVERSSLVQYLGSEDAEGLIRTMDESRTLKEEVAILQAARKAGVQEVVFADRTGDNRAPMVSVRGLRADSGQVYWSGSARYAEYEVRPLKHALANLTCEALATAWRFRAPGTSRSADSEEMCDKSGP